MKRKMKPMTKTEEEDKEMITVEKTMRRTKRLS